jgi:ABC-type phosphate/phosphonate transport system substrate-binding protein
LQSGIRRFAAIGGVIASRILVRFGVSEGTSGGASFLDVLVKYQPLAGEIGRVLGGKVHVLLVREFDRLEAGMRERDFDIVMARPSDYPARGLRDYGWRYVATARPDGHCLLIVKKDSPLQTIADARGRRFILPESSAYMTRFCRAELRDRGIAVEKESVQYTREQSTVAFALQAGQADIGIRGFDLATGSKLRALLGWLEK